MCSPSYLIAQASASVSVHGGAGTGASDGGAAAQLHGEGDEDGLESTRPRQSPRPNNNDNNVEVEAESESEPRSCPLCSEKFPSQERLESHAMSVHSVNSEGLQRLQSLINGSHWLNKKDQQGKGISFFICM